MPAEPPNGTLRQTLGSDFVACAHHGAERRTGQGVRELFDLTMTELSREAFLAAAVAAKDTFIEETDACIENKIAPWYVGAAVRAGNQINIRQFVATALSQLSARAR